MWWGGVVEIFCCMKTEKSRMSTSMPCLSSSTWGEQDSGRRAGCTNLSGSPVAGAACSEPSCHVRQSLVVCTSALHRVQETLPISNLGARPPFQPSLQKARQVAQDPEDHILNTAFQERHTAHLVRVLFPIVEKASPSFVWGFEYLILLYHLTIAARKVVFSHCAHSVPVTETRYSGMQPAEEQKVWFCSSRQRDPAQSTRQPVPPWCEKLLSFPVALPDSRLRCSAAASGINLCGFHVWQPRITTSKQSWSESGRQQAQHRSLPIAMLELPQSCQGLLFLGEEMVMVAAVQTTSLRGLLLLG